MKRLTLSLFFFSLGLISTCALGAESPEREGIPSVSQVLSNLQKEKLPIENLPIPNSPFSLTFKNDQIALYEDEKLVSSYDTKTPRFYVDGKPIIDKWQLINVLYEASSQAVYVHARLPMYDWPILCMTKNSVTELYKGENYTVWNIFVGADENVYANRSRWASDVNKEIVRIRAENEATS
jgi:hypothetical protein